VRAVFAAFDVSGDGLVNAMSLKRRCVAVEHPAVKAGRLSAREALQVFTRPWRHLSEVTVEEFLAGHGALSGVWTGNDEGFARMVCRLWGVPLSSQTAVRAGVLQQGGPKPISQAKAFVDDRLWLDSRANQSDQMQNADFNFSDYPEKAMLVPANEHPKARDRAFLLAMGQPVTKGPPMDRIGRAAGNFGQRELLVDDSLPYQFPGTAAGQEEVLWESIPDDPYMEETQQKEHAQASLRIAPHAQIVLERLRVALQHRGSNALSDLSQRLRISGRGQGGRVTASELGAAIRQSGVGIPHGDAADLAYVADLDGIGCANVEKLLSFLGTPLSPQRAAVVRDVFRRLDADRDGLVSVQELLDRFVPGRHPDVEAGLKNGREVLFEFQAALSNLSKGGRLSAPNFLRFYEEISAGIASDQYFTHFVRSVWGLESGSAGHRANNVQRSRGNIRVYEAGLG